MPGPARIVSLGCRLNAYEAERMAELAGASGRGETVVVNTCAVTNEAVRQSRQAIRRAARHHPGARILVSGCAAEIDRAAFAGMAEVSQVIGNAAKLDPAAYGEDPQTPVPVGEATTLPRSAVALDRVAVRAPLEVQNGCDHSCTFCIIPLGRGRARSKTVDDIVREARILVGAGAKELVLTGVDLTSYGPDLGEEMTLADPLEALLRALPGAISIRLSSIDGAEVDDRLFRLVTEEARVAPHLHLSLQAGDDMVLKRMKRRHDRRAAVRLSERLRASRPDMALGADLIAGFPTETETMFDRTRALIDDAGLSYVHVFPFSPRAGTAAARMPPVPRPVVKERAARLRAAADAALRVRLDAQKGRVRSMLVESVADGQAVGKLDSFEDVKAPAAGPPGTRRRLLVTGHDGRRLTARPLDGIGALSDG